MDPDYAPAWGELGIRAYYDATYSDGGEAMYQLSNQACSKALALDPNLTPAAGQLITNLVERGELGKAYEAAQALVKRQPDNAQAHFVMSYVYRYAGLLQEATGECNTALALDPSNYIFRSCAWPFMELGQTDRAADFVRLDAGSEWAAYVTPSLLLREGKIAEAREAVKHMPTAPRYHRDVLEACLQLKPESELDRSGHGIGNQLSVGSRSRDVVLRRSAVRVLRKKEGSHSSVAKRDREQLLRILQPADRSAADQVPLRSRHRQIADRCASMSGGGESSGGGNRPVKLQRRAFSSGGSENLSSIVFALLRIDNFSNDSRKTT